MSDINRISPPPRKGTRRRAVYDLLVRDWKDGRYTTWASAKAAYDNCEPSHSAHSRQYSGMELARILKKYADRMSRGQYFLSQWHRDGDKVWNTSGEERMSTKICHCGGEKFIEYFDSDSVCCKECGRMDQYVLSEEPDTKFEDDPPQDQVETYIPLHEHNEKLNDIDNAITNAIRMLNDMRTAPICEFMFKIDDLEAQLIGIQSNHINS